MNYLNVFSISIYNFCTISSVIPPQSPDAQRTLDPPPINEIIYELALNAVYILDINPGAMFLYCHSQ